MDDGFPPKPKGMHWRTNRRLEQLDEHLADRWRVEWPDTSSGSIAEGRSDASKMEIPT